MKLGRKRIISCLLATTLSLSCMFPSYATEVQDAKNKEQQLENERNEAQAEQKALLEQINQLTISLKSATDELANKKDEIEAAEQELIMAQIEEAEQYQSMKLRIQYMYENGNRNLIQIFLESENISDFLSKTEYILMMSKYDREKLEEFQKAVQKVKEKEAALEAEYAELSTLQASISEQKQQVEVLLSQNAAVLESIDSQLVDVREQIKKAEEAERKRKEAEEAERKRREEEAKRREEEANKQQNSSKPNSSSSSSSSSSSGNSSSSSTSGSTSSSGNSSSSSSSSVVVSGNGYFTHPCPGMSWQSSYFGEVRQGIGDSRPHKGHDYAASAGTPIYAAAAGTVITAGYSYSAGYWVVINHGNGLVSKYMHMYAMPAVSTGQHVARGQYIGGVGTTGQSTGNHLHFQVEVYGVPVNPSKYM